jgi:hypothetical protein
MKFCIQVLILFYYLMEGERIEIVFYLLFCHEWSGYQVKGCLHVASVP